MLLWNYLFSPASADHKGLLSLPFPWAILNFERVNAITEWWLSKWLAWILQANPSVPARGDLE